MKNLTNAQDIIESGFADKSDLPALEAIEKKFSILVPSTLADLIRTPNDPVAKQVIPSKDELTTKEYELSDPICDEKFSPIKGIVHRYPNRILLKPVLSCPLYCRFCFRREQVGRNGADATLSTEEITTALNWISDHAEIHEVILSGGDPLILSTSKLKTIINRLEAIEHVKTIRIHTRVPIAAPHLITNEMLQLFGTMTKPLWVAIHINHAQEIGSKAAKALKDLNKSGAVLLSQSVLLRGVNDTSESLEGLLIALIENRVKPYYLHHLDPAKGTSHFHVSVEKGIELLKSLRGKISGLCWPLYVVDLPGGAGKVPLGPSYYLSSDNGLERAVSPAGQEISFF